MTATFSELLAKIPKNKRTDRLSVLLVLLVRSAVDAKSAISSKDVGDELRSRLRGKAPQNVSDTLSKASPDVERVQEPGQSSRWYLTKSGIARLQAHDLDVQASAESAPKIPMPAARSSRVFLVHGHDGGAKARVARFLEKLGLEAIILHEQPNQGRTVIEKFSAYADVEYAVVLLTADDVGAAKSDPKALKPRARQNVVFELGFFVAKLGRTHVCALCEDGVELPSDISGVLYVRLDSGDAWRTDIARELNAVNIPIDLKKVL